MSSLSAVAQPSEHNFNASTLALHPQAGMAWFVVPLTWIAHCCSFPSVYPLCLPPWVYCGPGSLSKVLEDGRQFDADTLSSKIGLYNTGRLMKTLVAWWVMRKSLNPLGFEEQGGHSSDEGCSGTCWAHESSSSRQIVTDLSSSSLLTKWLYRLSYTSQSVTHTSLMCFVVEQKLEIPIYQLFSGP